MSDWFCGLLGLSFVLLFVTVVGHGLWLLGAACWRFLASDPRATPSQPINYAEAMPCKLCGTNQAVVNGRCRFCGEVKANALYANLHNDLQATLRQVERLWRRGILNDEEHARLIAACKKDLARLAGQATPAQPPPQPAASPVAVAVKPPELKTPAPVAVVAPVVAPILAEVVDAEVVEAASDSASTPVPVLKANVHPLDRPDEPAVAPPPPVAPRARRALADVLAAFMQERNIRWGELVSGLLIVGSAVGLVISLRATLRDWIPYFPALLFLLGTAAIHAAGLYTLKRWNLRSTSRGVLIISQLLVPLNFLAAIVISGADDRLPVTSLAYIAAVTIGLISYGAICWTGAEALQGKNWQPTALAVYGASTSQLLIHRLFTDEAAAWQTLLLALLPVGSFVVAMLLALARARAWRTLSLRRAASLYVPLSLGSFALIVALVLLVSKSSWPRETLATITPALAAVAATVIAIGAFIAQRTSARRLAVLSTSGLALAIAGGLLMLIAVGLAWPIPAKLVVVGALSCAALVALALTMRLPFLHVPAVGCAALVCLVGFHNWQGAYALPSEDLSLRMVETWSMGRSAVVLCLVAMAASAVAGLFLRLGRRLDAWCYLGSAAGVGAISLLIAGWAGFVSGVDVVWTTPLFAFYALVTAVVTAFLPRREVTWTAAALSLAAIVHAAHFNPAVIGWLGEHHMLPERPVVLGVLIHANLLALIALGLWLTKRSSSTWLREVIDPLSQAGLVGTMLCAWFAAVVSGQHFGRHAGFTCAVASVWLIAAVVQRSPLCFTAAQTVLALSWSYAAIEFCQQQNWWDPAALDARTIYVVAAALALWCAAWAISRRATERWPAVCELIAPPWPAVDQGVLALVVMVVLSVPGMSAWKLIDVELSTQTFDVAAQLAQVWEFAASPLVWLAWGTTIIALVASLWERLNLPALCGILLLGITPCMVLAMEAEPQLASASMLRWSLAIYGVIATALICLRTQCQQALARLPGVFRGELPTYSTGTCIALILLRAALPVIGLTLLACSLQIQGIAPPGPLVGSFFQRLGPTWSYGVPLLLLVVVAWLLALRERQPAYALGGSLVWQLLVSLACVMAAVLGGGRIDLTFFALLLQYNALGLAVFTLVWQTLARWLRAPHSQGTEVSRDLPLDAQVSMLILALLSLAVWATMAVLGNRTGATPLVAQQLGDARSFLAFGLGTAAIVWYGGIAARQALLSLCLTLGVALTPIIAAALMPWESIFAWFGFHALTTGWLLLATVATVLVTSQVLSGESQRRQALTWALGLLSVVMAIVFATGWRDPLHWVSAAQSGWALVLVLGLGYCLRRHEYAYVTSPLAMLTTTLAWWHFWPHQSQQGSEVIALNLLALTLVHGWWLAVEILRERANKDEPRTWLLSPVLLFTPLVSVAFLLLTLSGLFVEGRVVSLRTYPLVLTPPNIALAVALGGYLLATLWWSRLRSGLPGLYVWGLGVSLLPAAVLAEAPDWQATMLGLAVAAYVALTGFLWWQGAILALWGQTCGVREPIAGLERTGRWLPVVTLALAGAVVCWEFGGVLLLEERALRFAAAFAPVLLAIGVAMQAQQQRRSLMLYLSLCLATIAAVYLGWADLGPGNGAEVWLQRVIRLLVVLGSLAFVYGGVLTRVWCHLADWLTALWRMALTCGAGAAASLVAILAMEVLHFTPGENSPINTAQVLVVAVVMVLLAAAQVIVALSRRSADLARWLPSEQHRMACVYLAQVTLALMFGHLYLTRPLWFDGLLRPYWPFVVMAIAFAGVGLGEALQRMRMRVLAEPLQRTGLFLPLIPALGWWIGALRHDAEATTSYALVMFVVGLLYAMYSMCRRSPWGAILAGIAGNISLLSMIHDRGLVFTAHPQFWLIPPALSVLAAVQMQSKRLTEEQIAATRYVCMLAIYLSSTSEIFITGIGDSLWQPLLLAALAVLGVLAGIVFQVRAFLYLGTSFVFLAMVTMVWHAAQALHHVWPWWAFGICLGLAILTFFGLFEKKRAEISALVDRLRQWEP